MIDKLNSLKDLVISVVFIVFLWLIFSHYDVFEMILKYVESHESYELDELLLLFIIMGIMSIFYSIRRVTEAKKINIQLQNINKSLEKKVEDGILKQLKRDEMIIQQRHASLGEMIGNIAHQWRQPLSIISTLATGIKMNKELNILTDEELDKSVTLINDNAQHLSHTIDIFRAFLKNDKTTETVILQDLINKVLYIQEAIIKNNHIRIINNVSMIEPVKVQLVTGELSQVLINIINNAKDICIEKQIDNPWIKIDLEVDKVITLSIEDNGGGVPTSVIEQIFEPYFSTKHQLNGTGLGLYMSYKIVTESLKGKIFVKNTKSGAKFYIELPLEIIDNKDL